MATSSPKIAILILAHKNPAQVKRLVRHLDFDFDVFIHIDRRSPIMVSDFDEFARTAVMKKYKSTWGGLGIVEATLELFRLATRGSCYDRYVLISGQDVPLWTNLQISSFFNQNREVDFVEMKALGAKDESVLERVTAYHFFPKNVRSWAWLQKGHISYLLTRLAAGLGHTLNRLFMARVFRRPTDYFFYYGSQWMDLKAATVQNLLQYVSQNPSFLRRFRFTHAPDEFFFQSAIGNCGVLPSSTARPLRYIDWERGPEHPRVIRLDDLPRLESSKMMFARKLDESIDSNVIEELYARLGRDIS